MNELQDMTFKTQAPGPMHPRTAQSCERLPACQASKQQSARSRRRLLVRPGDFPVLLARVSRTPVQHRSAYLRNLAGSNLNLAQVLRA